MTLLSENPAPRGLLITALTGLLAGVIGSGCRTPPPAKGRCRPAADGGSTGR
jgi:hypothetical protein